MDATQVQTLYKQAKMLWVQLEEYSIAYHGGYKKKSSQASLFTNLTMVAAIITAVITAIVAANSTGELNSIANFGWIPAAITAAVSVVSNFKQPEKERQSLWEKFVAIETLKSEVSSRSVSLYLAESWTKEQLVWVGFSKSLSKILQADIEVTPEHKEKALKAFDMIDIEPVAPSAMKQAAIAPEAVPPIFPDEILTERDQAEENYPDNANPLLPDDEIGIEDEESDPTQDEILDPTEIGNEVVRIERGGLA